VGIFRFLYAIREPAEKEGSTKLVFEAGLSEYFRPNGNERDKSEDQSFKPDRFDRFFQPGVKTPTKPSQGLERLNNRRTNTYRPGYQTLEWDGRKRSGSAGSIFYFKIGFVNGVNITQFPATPATGIDPDGS